MTSPKKVVTPPSWLNVSFIEKALKNGLKDENIKVNAFEIKMATSAGDNYASNIFRINLKLTRSGNEGNANETKEDFSVIAKIILSGPMRDTFHKLKLFEKEARGLTETLPKVHQVLEKIYPDHEKLWPDCYYNQGQPDNLLILEDLSRSGYRLANRFEGLDLDHAVLVLKSLAKLHAGSLSVIKEHPEIKNLYPTFWTSEAADLLKNSVFQPLETVSREVKMWTDLEKREFYSDKLKILKDDILDRSFEIWKRDNSKLNVLLHGDSWLNNYMFRYDSSNKVNGVKLIDFQIMNYNSPSLELQYFIFGSVKNDLKISHIDFFLETYYNAFEDALNRLNITLDVPYDLNKLKEDFESKYFWGFAILFTFVPLSTLPNDEVFDVEDFFEGSSKDIPDKLERLYKRDDIQKLLRKALQFFDSKGII